MKIEEALFADALALSPAEREDFLARACGADAPLRQRVEILLRGYESDGVVLEHLPVPEANDVARACTDRIAREYASGARIGRYKLLQQLGEGGCGVVFMAEQEDPVRRMVAVKVIKLGMDTREVIARFEAERQVLALMDHPNIAHVLDAGSTDGGRPFFVMELVRGTPITRYCDEHGVGTTERMQLFTHVCHAVQHAHQKGIIHRDLKPSNILVTLHDGVPVPKIIDFGIAKATQGRLTDKTLFTTFEQFVGTPAYMSPEQTEMSGLDVDTRSDIYSLGVLLYELLTGRTPFESQELAKAGLEEMRRIIREREPPKPSTRVSTIAGDLGTTIAKQRGTEPAKLSALLRGDLDWIVMRCLAKDRTRRYETANGLAMDIQRHLVHEPISARPPSTAYVLQRVIRRNKLAFASATAVVAALALGLTFALIALQRERAARARADREAARSAQVARFMQDMLAGVGPRAALGRDTELLRAILDDTVVRLNNDLQRQPEVEAGLRETLGHVYRDLGEFSAAGLMHERALQLRRQFFGAEHTAVADSLHALGDIRARQGKLDEAEALLRDAVALRDRLQGSNHDPAAASRAALAHVQLLRSQANAGTDVHPDSANRSTSGSKPPKDRPASAGTGAFRRESGDSKSGEQPTLRDKPAPTGPAAADQPAVIRLVISGGAVAGKPRNATALGAVQQQGSLEAEFANDGIRIEWGFITDSRETHEAYVRDAADFSNMAPIEAVKVRAEGVGYKVLMALRRHDAGSALVVHADSPYQTVADLRDRRLAIYPGSDYHLRLHRILERHGFSTSDFELVSLDGRAAAYLTALLAREVDAVPVDLDFHLGERERRAVRVVFDPGRDPVFGGVGKLCVSGEFERQYPAIVQRVVTTLVRMAAWVADERNRAATLQLWATSPENLLALERAYYSGRTIAERHSPLLDEYFLADLRRDCADMKRFGMIAADADTSFDGWVEPKYLEHALQELGLESYWPERDAEGKLKGGP